MINHNEIRKKSGCWSCIYSSLSGVEVNAAVSCAHPEADIKAGFEGWETALICKGYRMMPREVSVEGDPHGK